MLLTIGNHKGGTGKTTIAMLLTSLAATIYKYEDRVYAVDLDEQLSFRRRIKELNAYGLSDWTKFLSADNPPISPIQMTEDPLPFAGDPTKICICDTPPSLMSAGERVASAVTNADLLIIPTTSDRDAVQAAVRTAAAFVAGNKREASAVAVLTRVEGIERDKQAEAYLRSKDVFSRTFLFPKHNQLVTNIDVGKSWWVGMRSQARMALTADLWDILRLGGIKI